MLAEGQTVRFISTASEMIIAGKYFKLLHLLLLIICCYCEHIARIYKRKALFLSRTDQLACLIIIITLCFFIFCC